MYYISGIQDGIYSITDTKDNVTEQYNYDQVCYFVNELGLKIGGVSSNNHSISISVYNFTTKTVSDLAKSFTILDKSMLGMGDSHSEIVENLSRMTRVGNGLSFYGLSSDVLDDLSNQAYQILIDRKDPYLKEVINYILDDKYENYETVKSSMYAECVDTVSKSIIYKAVYTIYKYFSEFDKKLAKEIKNKLIEDIKQNGVASIRVGYDIGHEYFRYLDSKIFGTITNCRYTVGHALTNDDKREFKELKPYSYMHCKDFNRLSPKPEISLVYLYRNGENGKVVVDVKIGRQGYISDCVMSTVGYIKDVGSLTLDANNPDNAKIIADHCNKLAVKAWKFAEAHESLMHLLPLGSSVEKY